MRTKITGAAVLFTCGLLVAFTTSHTELGFALIAMVILAAAGWLLTAIFKRANL